MSGSFKAAIPIFQGRVSPVFDWCGNLLLVEIRSGQEVQRQEVEVASTDPVLKTNRLVELGANLLVCGGISELLLSLIESRDIRVIPWVAGGIDDVLAALVSGNLPHPRFMMPGYAGQRGRHRVRRGFGGRGRKHGRR